MKTNLITWALLIAWSFCAWSAEQRSQLWLDLSINDELFRDSKINYNLEVQSRFVDQADYYATSFVAGGLGYRSTDLLSFWAGYEWVSHNDVYDIASQNIFWEQMVWQVFQNDDVVIRTRTRFEQIERNHEAEWESKLREKISFYFPSKLMGWTPLIYEEVLIKLNNPSWSDTKTIESNRIFVGLDIPATQKMFFEVGYIQQTIFGNTQTTFDNVLYLGININPTGRSIPQYIR